jgi:hypothetical protein
MPTTPGSSTPAGGVLVRGHGVAGRLEVSVEVDDEVRHLVTEPLWAQVAPGNARSLRAFQAAGYRPVGSEALFLLPRGQAISARARSAGCSRTRS